MAHQEEAIRWLLAHARRAGHLRRGGPERRGWGAGALLADDMGLGKTFSSLVAIAEWFRHWRAATDCQPPAALIVAPLSLLENWLAEIEKTFSSERSPFKRVLLAQPDLDLNRFKRFPGAQDRAEPGRVREFGLYFGDGSEMSLDWPGSCVITTYQTLRDYRFSFAAAEWSTAVFDEAQNLKNPNAQQTIAAKALRALFRIAMTGTPVENHLGDFWSILDAAEPGPLGSFSDFRKRWIAPILRDRERMDQVGKELRDHVGGLMLRRTKKERLSGIPPKTIASSICPMSAEQQTIYEQARDAVTATADTTQTRQGKQLAALWHLRQVSLHPDLIGSGRMAMAQTAAGCRRILRRSGKLAWLLEQLDTLKDRSEKVLVFCVLKQLQEGLSRHLEVIYGVPVPVINGDTKATSRTAPEQTRLGLIDEFSRQTGFAVCILSPIAAGAGLNIVAANHVIHLERHWNPAKEDQATDRAYRIGQTKPVTVYLPLVTHPAFDSFDLILHRLLEKKRSLQGALGLVPPESVSGPELIAEVFGEQRAQNNSGSAQALTLDAALKLSWKMFEALIAVLYEREAVRVILTPHGCDHGSDVVVLGWGPNRDNLLVQCNTSANETLDSEEGVRAVAASQPFFECPLGVTFTRKVLHSTAKSFGGRSRRAAQICTVELRGQDWLKAALEEFKPSLGDVLQRELRREKVA
jgi:SNF2 family DNA or RNA helicase